MQVSCSGSVVCDKLPPLSAKYPWLVAQNLDGTKDQSFYTINDQLCRYRCQIPELIGRLIRGYFHGWAVLSSYNNVMWSIWNPVTREIINFPPLIMYDGADYEFGGDCCLSFPPDDTSSILLLTKSNKPTFVFCQLDYKTKGLGWIEMSYANQLERIAGHSGLLRDLTFFNGKVYALHVALFNLVIQVNIVVKDGGAVIKLTLLGPTPFPSFNYCPGVFSFLKGSSTEMFYITLAYNELTKKSIGNVYLFKWDMTTSMRWEQMDEIDRKDYTKTRKLWEEVADLKDTIFFVNLARDYSVFYRRTIASELGGYVHIHDKMYNLMYSYDIQDKTISIISSKLSPLTHLSMWECARLEADLGEAMCTLQSERKKDNDDKKIVVRSFIDNKEVEMNESHLLNTPFHILEMIMQLCVGVEYMHFRATCKRCNLAAPLILWSNKTSALRKYSLVSPWLMVMDKNQGIFSFTDPMFGDKYFMKNSQVSVVRPDRACCSRFGWLLFYSDFSYYFQQCRDVYNLDFTSNNLVFFNPFTNDVRMLPPVVTFLPILSFSAPPTSPDCIVIGFKRGGEPLAYIHLVGREPYWRVLRLGPNVYHSFFIPTFYSQDVCALTFYSDDVYALCNEGQLYVLQNIVQHDYSWKQVAAARTSCRGSSSQCFLVRGDQHLLLVTVSKFGENVEVFKLNDYTKEWEKVNCLGRHMIYISGTTCLCIEAKTPEMENKVYFPRLHSRNGKIVFYSLETRRYHTFKGKNIQENTGFGFEHVYPHVWIEPSWS